MLVAPPGGTLTATSMIDQGASVAGATAGWTEIRWYDALNTLLKTDKGNAVDSGSRGAWHASTVTSTAPASAAYAKAAIHLTSVADHDHEIFGDNLVITGAIAGLPEVWSTRPFRPNLGLRAAASRRGRASSANRWSTTR
ncbi:hypothetical protein SNK04_013948 [Fusarium graminearum]